MSTVNQYHHLTIDEHGCARVSGTRYKVQHLAGEHFYFGWTAEELLRQHPDLRPEQVYAALTYFYDHFDEIVAGLKRSAEESEHLRNQQTVSRDELLKRKTALGPT